MTGWAKSMVRGSVHTALAPLERRLLAQHGTARWPHVFIVGAPRSGTSLFYELLVTRYRFSFFSNLAHRFYKTPVAATRLGRSAIETRQSLFQSSYGHISGWTAPNEGGWIWQRWLEDGPWTDESVLPGLPADEIRATLAAISHVLDAPFVNKNVMHANRLRLLQALFPDCLILEVQRDPADTVRSIVRARQRNKGPGLNLDQWWSVQPSNAGGGNLVEQACRQVTGVAADIARDSGAAGHANRFSIDYAELCAAPEATLDRVASFLAANGVPAAERGAIPEVFTPPTSAPLPEADEARLHRLLQTQPKEAR